MLKSYNISVDLEKKTSPQSFSISQNDLNTIELNIHLTNNKKTLDITGMTPRIVIKKPSYLTVIQDCTVVSALTGDIKVILNTQAYSEPGQHQAEIYLYEGENVLVTETFSYMSNKAILNDKAFKSSNEWQSINDALIQIDDGISRIENADVYTKIEADVKLTSLNNSVTNSLTGKVDRVFGKDLSTNDYDNIEKAEVAKVKNKADTSYVDSGLVVKVDKVAGKGLSTNDYDSTEKSEVAKVKNKADTTYVDNQISTVNASLSDMATKGLPSKANKNDFGVFLSDYPIQVPEVNDSGRISRAISATTTGGKLFLGSNISLLIGSKVTITKSIHIIGFNTELKTVTAGLDKSLLIQNVTDFSISGVRFNQNLLGRTSIHLSNVTDFIIENCYFTGYSLDYGFYQTDSGILMDSCINGRISRNLWENHGYQYDNATNHLNRCITVQSSCDRIVISNNQFDKVNQGIVIDSTNVIASGNTFNEVKDNSFYIVGGSGFSIQGNIFTGQRDEAIVFGGISDISITGNIFREVTNKIFTIDGDTQNVTISGNTTENITQSFANIMSYRQNTFTVKNMNISGNTFRSIVNGNSFDIFQLGNLDGLIMNGNVIEVVTVSSQRIIGFSGATLVSGIIANNIFKCSTFDTAVISRAVVPTTYSMTFTNNEMNNGRFSMTPDLNCEGYDVNNLNYATKLRKKKTIFTAAVPTSGTWQRGDILYNTTEGSTTRGWECTTSGVAGSTAVFTAF